MAVFSTDHHPTLRHVDRESIGIELQGILAILIDLSLTGKHAHWNVQGPHFRSLHLQLDDLADPCPWHRAIVGDVSRWQQPATLAP